MFRNIRRTIVSLLSITALAIVPVAVPAIAFAANDDVSESGASIQKCLAQGSGLSVPEVDTQCDDSELEGGDSSGLNDIIRVVINAFSILVGVVAVIMIIYGGFRYITSGGDSTKITAAKNTIIYAIIGLVVVALAQVIVQFVLSKITQNT